MRNHQALHNSFDVFKPNLRMVEKRGQRSEGGKHPPSEREKE
jgi:hypothetical protein